VQNNYYNNYTSINIYKNNSASSELSTQMLYGEKFKLIKKNGDWWKIILNDDKYIVYIKKKKFKKKITYHYKISCLKANIYNSPSNKKKIKNKLPFASKISAISKSGSFIEFEKNKWIKTSDIKPISYKTNNIFEKIKIFKGTKYKWGGKDYRGIDCSALIQLCFTFNNRYFPRDSKDQFKYLKKKIQRKNIKKNDLFFWKGHVAIATSKKNLIHAYGPFKKVIMMKIDKTIKKIENTANLKLISIKRI
jgi:cell wall-associated NlpC family hydrolase